MFLTHDGINPVYPEFESSIDMVAFKNLDPSGKMIFRVKQPFTYIPASYQFYFEITTKGNTKTLSPMIELVVYCDENSVRIEKPFLQNP